MFGKLDKSQIEELLTHQLIGHLGCHAEGKTYVIPLSYAYDGKDIYVHSYRGLKTEIMTKNPQVCFQVDDTKDLANWMSVICWGEFEELKGEAEIKMALHKLSTRVLPILSSETMHLSRDWPFPSDNHEKAEGVFFRIHVREKTGRFEKIVGEDFFAT